MNHLNMTFAYLSLSWVIFFLEETNHSNRGGGRAEPKKQQCFDTFGKSEWCWCYLPFAQPLGCFRHFASETSAAILRLPKKLEKNAHQNSNISHIHNSMKMNKMSVAQWCVRSILLPKTFKLIWHRLATPNTKYLNLLKTKHRGRKNVVKIRKKMKN